MAFADLPKNRGRYPLMDAMFGGHIFDRGLQEHGVIHKLTKPCHPWTNGQAERKNRTPEAAVDADSRGSASQAGAQSARVKPAPHAQSRPPIRR